MANEEEPFDFPPEDEDEAAACDYAQETVGNEVLLERELEKLEALDQLLDQDAEGEAEEPVDPEDDQTEPEILPEILPTTPVTDYP